MACSGVFSTGVTYTFEKRTDVGRFNGEDISDDKAYCHRWTAADRPIVLAILRAYERQLEIDHLRFSEYEGMDRLEAMVAPFKDREVNALQQRYLLGCIIYQQLLSVDRLLFVYDG